MARIFCDFVDPYGFAIIYTRGFFVDYLDYVSEQSIDKKSNFVLIRDLDPSGILIELAARLITQRTDMTDNNKTGLKILSR